jgi:hypothetical protein
MSRLTDSLSCTAGRFSHSHQTSILSTPSCKHLPRRKLQKPTTQAQEGTKPQRIFLPCPIYSEKGNKCSASENKKKKRGYLFLKYAKPPTIPISAAGMQQHESGLCEPSTAVLFAKSPSMLSEPDIGTVAV